MLCGLFLEERIRERRKWVRIAGKENGGKIGAFISFSLLQTVIKTKTVALSEQLSGVSPAV